jgi:hypothetical protein
VSYPSTPTPKPSISRLLEQLQDKRFVRESKPFIVLIKVRALRNALATYEGQLVLSARRRGASWADIGEELGITKQSAWEQYHHVD